VRVLVTGATGFAGRHVLAAVAAAGHEPLGFGGPHEPPPSLDLRDADGVRSAVATSGADAIIHLAGQAFVPPSIADPLATLAVNATGTAHLLEAVRAARRPIRTLIVSSAEVYGAQRPERMPLDESVPLRPENPYAASKVAAETYAGVWSRLYGLDVVIARPFNHIGPGQDARFVVPSFARQLAAIAAGAPPLLAVGNLTTERDFLDVRDVAGAYVALLANGRPGSVYNVCSGHAVAIHEVLRQLITIARVPVDVRDDPERLRPSDIPVLCGDATRLRTDTGWSPQVGLTASLRDIYADARERLAGVRA
jgi:GDP-4-dehydro-6-deoxy-D-mannose reductase